MKCETAFRILLVDDSPMTLEVAGRILSEAGYRIQTASDVPQAIRSVEVDPMDLVITDFRMPGHDGLDLIHYLRENCPEIPVIMLTGFPSIEGAVKAVRGGAEAYLSKPFTREELLGSVTSVLRQRSPGGVTDRDLPDVLAGKSEDARKLRRLLKANAENRGPILLLGPEPSLAMEWAKALHRASPRRDEVFITLHCGLPDFDAFDLFGKDDCSGGAVGRAHRGTLVLEEIGRLDSDCQRRVLRLLQQRSCIPVEGGRTRPVDCRIIAIARRDLPRMVARGRFRRDLLEALEGNRVRIPDLNERKQDLPELIRRILRSEARLVGTDPPELTAEALQRLIETPWNGGIGELRQSLSELVFSLPEGPVDIVNLPRRFRFRLKETEEMLSLQTLETLYIRQVLDRVGGNKTEAARILGIDRKTLRTRLGE